jgi:hypothetical protein
LIFGAADFAVGENRVTFLVVRPNGDMVDTPRARLVFAREGASRRELTAARLVPVGPHSHPNGSPHNYEDPEASEIYVATVSLPKVGRYWLVAEPAGDRTQAFGTIDVLRRTRTPAIGSKAIASDTPTLADAPATKITTARPPDTALLRHSVKDSLADRAPFVVVFATPAYCTSRTCGPTVEVVDAARQKLAHSGVRFIHVEIYRDNNPQLGPNRWVREWRLPSEPWVFLVDRRGIIRSKFEGAVSVGELDTAIRRHLLERR